MKIGDKVRYIGNWSNSPFPYGYVTTIKGIEWDSMFHGYITIYEDMDNPATARMLSGDISDFEKIPSFTDYYKKL